MDRALDVERIDTLVIGGGQAGLSVGYHLARRDVPFLVVDACARIGDAWRSRWDSLRLFTAAGFDGLDGMPFPDHRHTFPTKDAMADYLEAYAARFELPVRTGVRVDSLRRTDGGRWVARAGSTSFEADNVVVAMASYQEPKEPSFADDLDPDIVRMHSVDYRRPDQLPDGPVLLVGAGNTGSELAMELSRDRRVWMSGRDVGEIPFRPRGFLGRTLLVRLVLRVLFHRVLTVDTPLGRKARPKILSQGGPLIRVKSRDLRRAGVERVPRVAGTERGRPRLEDGRVLEPASVIWCTGFHPGFDWIDVPVDGHGEPQHRSGVVDARPGLYFVGLHFLHAMSSTMVHGVGRDAERIAGLVAARPRYSERNAPTGSMRVTRRAGTHAATRATAASTSGTPTKVSGSSAGTP